MGNGVTKDQRTKEIDKEIRKEKTDTMNDVRLILLGSGESGKSTLVRQMKLLKAGGYSEDDKWYFRDHVCRNLVEWSVELGRTLMEYNDNDIFPETVKTLEDWGKVQSNGIVFPEEIKDAIRAILNSPENSSKSDALLSLQDSAVYFFDHAERLMAEEFLPTGEDIVRCRIATVGVYQLKFTSGKSSFCIIDVGGQRGQRKKWINFFDNIQGMIFVTALSDYDKCLAEDRETNRMVDSIDLWEKIMKYPIFEKTPTLIFFNKNDKFEEKLRRIPLTVCFEKYKISQTGESVDIEVFESAREYIKARFMERRSPEKQVYTHFTTATDKTNVDRVMQLTIDIVLAENAKTLGFAS